MDENTKAQAVTADDLKIAVQDLESHIDDEISSVGLEVSGLEHKLSEIDEKLDTLLAAVKRIQRSRSTSAKRSGRR